MPSIAKLQWGDRGQGARHLLERRLHVRIVVNQLRLPRESVGPEEGLQESLLAAGRQHGDEADLRARLGSLQDARLGPLPAPAPPTPALLDTAHDEGTLQRGCGMQQQTCTSRQRVLGGVGARVCLAAGGPPGASQLVMMFTTLLQRTGCPCAMHHRRSCTGR